MQRYDELDESRGGARRRARTAVIVVALPLTLLLALTLVGRSIGSAPVRATETEQAQDEPAAVDDPAPVAAGSYRYTADGTMVSSDSRPERLEGEIVLRVEADESSRHRQAWADGPSARELVVADREDGLVAERLMLSTPAFSFALEAPSGLMLLPAGAPVGSTWTWTSASADGEVSVSASYALVRREQLERGAGVTPAVVVSSAWTMTGRVTGTMTQLTWYSPRDGSVLRHREEVIAQMGDDRYRSDLLLDLVDPDPGGAE
jgi:hypothetical protein